MAVMTSSLVALAFFVAAANAQYGMGGMGLVPGMGHPALHMEDDHHEPEYLTCLVRFRDPAAPNTILNAIAVNIQEKSPSRDSHSHSNSWMGMMGPLMGQQQQDDGGLEAYVQMFSTTGGPVSIAFTDAARPEEGCAAEDFGYFLRHPGSQRGHSMGGRMPMMGGYPGLGGMGAMKYGMGGMGMKYGMGGMGMKYGMGGMGMKYGNPMMMNKQMMMMKGPMNPMMMGSYGRHPAMGHMMGGMHHPMMGMMDMDDHDHKPEGVFAETDLAPNMKATINIDRLEGFRSLSDLAGRGVVVCPTSMVDHHDDDAMCDGGILACCALHYDENKQMLS